MMKKAFFLHSLVFSLSVADMATIFNLELYDNQNPATLTHIRDQSNHFVYQTYYESNDETNNSIPSQESGQNYLGFRFFRNKDTLTIFFETNELIDKREPIVGDYGYSKSMYQIGFGYELDDFNALGVSFKSEIFSDTKSEKSLFIGMTTELDESSSIGYVGTLKTLQSDTMVLGFSGSLGAGYARRFDDNDWAFEGAFKYAARSEQTDPTLSDNIQPETLTASLQLQKERALNRSGLRYIYTLQSKEATWTDDKRSSKVELYKGGPLIEKDNLFLMLFLSYEQTLQGEVQATQLQIGFKLRQYF